MTTIQTTRNRTEAPPKPKSSLTLRPAIVVPYSLYRSRHILGTWLSSIRSLLSMYSAIIYWPVARCINSLHRMQKLGLEDDRRLLPCMFLRHARLMPRLSGYRVSSMSARARPDAFFFFLSEEEWQAQQANKQKEQESSSPCMMVRSSPNSKQSNLAPAAYASIFDSSPSVSVLCTATQRKHPNSHSQARCPVAAQRLMAFAPAFRIAGRRVYLYTETMQGRARLAFVWLCLLEDDRHASHRIFAYAYA